MHIEVETLKRLKIKCKESDLVFGKYFTDRMFLAEWKSDLGWHHARIKPYEPFSLDPSALVFHYGQEIFEGMKAYLWKDDTIAFFRPEMNAERFNRSAERLCMPKIPPQLFFKAIEELVLLEKEWIPKSFGTSLYIRPAMIAVEPVLGVRPSAHYYFFIILSPVGPYYPNGFHPIKIWVEDHYVRAAFGGMGEAKTGGNYASSLKATLEAKMKGCDQVLWLDSKEKRYIEEVGAMNMFFVSGDTLLTPPLDGAILHGITRDSILQLAASLDMRVEVRKIAIDELLADIQKGVITEAFGSGTAAIVTPVGALCYKDALVTIGEGTTGPIAQKMYKILTEIQYGITPDTFGWVKTIAKKPNYAKSLDRLINSSFSNM